VGTDTSAKLRAAATQYLVPHHEAAVELARAATRGKALHERGQRISTLKSVASRTLGRSALAVEYQMIGPEGDRHRGYWDILEAEAPHRLVFGDGVANADGAPNTDMQLATTRVTIEELEVGPTRMSIESSFTSPEAMEWILTTGTDEGRARAVGQIDAILAEQTIQR